MSFPGAKNTCRIAARRSSPGSGVSQKRVVIRAVGIGRPQVWGLAAFGQEGVERVLELFRAELTLTMRQCGIPNIAAITRAAILRNGARL